MSHLTDELKIKLAKFGIEPKKGLGQNFLVSDHVIQKIISAVKKFDESSQSTLQPIPISHLIEIGPGLGALTEHLMKWVSTHQNINTFTLLEWDHLFSSHWQTQGHELLKNRFSGSATTSTTSDDSTSFQFQVVDGDALKWKGWSSNEVIKSPSSTLLVSNLPYQISSSIVIDRSIDENPLLGMVLMFQKEVAQRIQSPSKSEHYGLLSVIAQTYWKIEVVSEAGPNDFYPPPKVASRVLCFRSKKSPITNHKKFLNFVKAGFAHRRKLLKSNLGAVGISASKSETCFQELGLSLQVRAEELSVEQWHRLFELAQV